MVYLYAIAIGIINFFLPHIHYKMRMRFKNDKPIKTDILILVTIVLTGVAGLSAMKFAWHFHGKDPGMAGLIAIIPGGIGAWIFKRRHQQANKNNHD